jgi:hypothetical protein
MPESDINVMNADNSTMLRLNRFSLLSRLGQYYLLDNMSRLLDMRLDQYRSRDYQSGVYGETYNADLSKSFLSSSYFGGARYLKNNAQDAS